KMRVRSIGLLLISCLSLSSAMFFDLGEREEKCIIEDIPQDTLVTGIFKMELWDGSKKDSAFHLGMNVAVRDPDFQTVMTKKYSQEGKFSFTSHTSGQHYICLQSTSTTFAVFAGDKLRVHLDVQIGEHTLDPSSVKAKDTVRALEYRLMHLIEEVRHIIKQQNYQREREETFRQTSEDINSNVLWWAIMQTFILITVGVWQMKQMKDFLIEKKLV
ncbi:TMD11 protein, partial [Atractosteus spatula]|nr:TMD11 protein [Atractosteus spatula]